MPIKTKEFIFPVYRTVWQYDPSASYGPYEIELFFEKFGLKVVSAPATGLTRWESDWLTFRTHDGEAHYVQPHGYIVVDRYSEAVAMTAEEFKAATGVTETT